ncbi:MAG: sarcosine oxidase subunit gamma [Hyphomicrobiaceae bacterium]
MADIGWAPRSALKRPLQIRASTIRIAASAHRWIVHIAAFRDRADAVRAAMFAAFAVELPQRPSMAAGRDLSFVWVGPGAWLAMAECTTERDLYAEISTVVQGVAAVTDQSDARQIFAVSGSAARDCLAKGFAIDLHPRSFKPGDAAVTHAAHIAATIWQLNDTPSYEIAVPRSYAESFAEWLHDAAAEFAAQ